MAEWNWTKGTWEGLSPQQINPASALAGEIGVIPNRGITTSADTIKNDPSFGYDFGEMNSWGDNLSTQQTPSEWSWLPTENNTGVLFPGLQLAGSAFNTLANYKNMKTQRRIADAQIDAMNKNFKAKMALAQASAFDKERSRISQEGGNYSDAAVKQAVSDKYGLDKIKLS